MIIERQLENAFMSTLSAMSDLSAAQIVGSRTIAASGLTKSEDSTAPTIVAVACGFRQNDAFSLSPISMPMSITIMTRTELDPTSECHDAVVESIADLLSRWHKYGEEMSEALTTKKFLAGELRMDGGTNRVYDTTNSTWSETITFTIRGSEKFTAPPVPYFPDSQGIKMSDGTFVPLTDMLLSLNLQSFNLALGAVTPYSAADIVELVAYSNVNLDSTALALNKLERVYIDSSCLRITSHYLLASDTVEEVVFNGRTYAEVQAMENYPWGIENTQNIHSIIGPNTRVKYSWSQSWDSLPLSGTLNSDDLPSRSGIRYIGIGSSIDEIGYRAFSGMEFLTGVEIPTTVTAIGAWAFSGAEGMTDIEIPSSVLSIGSDAFFGCHMLSSVMFEGKTLEQVQAMENYPWGIEDTSKIQVI